MKRFHYITLLRILAMISVIALHTILPPVTYFSDIYTNLEVKSSILLLNIFEIYAVPVFFMISGALMLNPQKNITVEKCIKKSLRIFVLLAVIGTFFALLEIIATKRDFSIIYLVESLFNMLADKSWAHLWYLYVLIGLYIVTPCLRKIVEYNGGGYLCIVLIIFNVLIPFFSDVADLLLSKYGWAGIAFKIPFSGTANTYYVLGWAISNEKIRLSNKNAVLIILGLSLYLFLAVFALKSFDGAKVLFWDINNLLGVLFSVSIFSLFYNNCQNGEDSRFQILLQEHSYGIYIVHAVFTNIAYQILKLNPRKLNILGMWILVFTFTFLLSFITTFILRKIPFIKRFI